MRFLKFQGVSQTQLREASAWSLASLIQTHFFKVLKFCVKLSIYLLVLLKLHMLDNSVIDPAAGRLHYSNESQSQCHLLATVNQHHVIPRTTFSVRYVCAMCFFFVFFFKSCAAVWCVLCGFCIMQPHGHRKWHVYATPKKIPGFKTSKWDLCFVYLWPQ